MKKLHTVFSFFLIISLTALLIPNVYGAEIGTKKYNYKNSSDSVAPGNYYKSNKTVLPSKAGEALPDKYSSAELGYTSPVRNQGSTGACWAFSGLSCLETSLLKNDKYTVPLSVAHMDAWGAVWGSNMDKEASLGTVIPGWQRVYSSDAGYPYISLGYLTSWEGAISENDAPFGSSYSDISLSDNYEKISAVNSLMYIDGDDRESVKRAIYEYGAVNTSYHSDTKYYSSDWNSYYCPVSTNNIMGHSISIVGWDDSYSKENFTVTVSSTTGSGTVVNTKYTPENDGAWLIKNSWGQSYNSLGGYFYISYEDYYLLNSFWGPSYAIMDTATDFENKKIMQNEIYGATYGFEYLDTESISNDIISYINVFDFESDFNTLDRINFESDAIGAKYEIYYVPVKSGIPVANKNIWTSLKKGEITYSGYITVDITDIQVPAGQGAIAVTLDTTDLDTYNILGVDEWLTSFGTKIFIPDSKKGQSFIYIDQKEDINSLSYLYGNMTDIMDIYKNTLKDNVGGTLVIKSVTEKSGESRVLGDSNGDKYLDIRDCTFIQKYLAKIVKEDEILTSLSDFNGDGSINIKDATKIQKYIVGIG